MYKVIICVLALFLGLAFSFSTQGNRLLDKNGNPILLRGIDRPSLEWQVDGQYLSVADYTLMNQWGANAVRLSLSQCFWLQTSTYANTVDQQVKWIKSLGMNVILDLHWSDQGGAATCNQQLMADSNSITFWTQVATKYANDDMILFELYNEPHDVSWSVWLNGGDTGAGWTSVGMQQLYNAVRATGADNVVIIGGLNWAYDLSGIPAYAVSGYNIMYNTHVYNFDGKLQADWPSGFGFLADTYPLIATEFGDYTCDGSFYSDFIDYANQNAISYTAWAWFVSGCAFPSIIDDWTGTPSASGLVIQNDLLHTSKIPGAPRNVSLSTGSSGSTGSNTGGNTGGSGSTGINLPLYSDSVVNFADWSWASPRNPVDSTYAHTGTKSYSFTPNLYAAVYFYKLGGISTTQYQGAQFWINGGASGNQQITVNLIKYVGTASNKVGPSNQVSSYTTTGTIPAGQWVQGYLDFSTFPAGTYDGLWFQDSTGSPQGTVYIDDVTLIAFSTSATVAPTVAPTLAPTAAPTPKPTKAPTPAPTAAATPAPTVAPTAAPTAAPTQKPTKAPTSAPTSVPTGAPTTAPSQAPTAAATNAPSVAPTSAPSVTPTSAPSVTPTSAPSGVPTHAAVNATQAPSDAPTTAPKNATHAPQPTATPTPLGESSSNSTCRVGSENCACGVMCDPGLDCVDKICTPAAAAIHGNSASLPTVSLALLALGGLVALW